MLLPSASARVPCPPTDSPRWTGCQHPPASPAALFTRGGKGLRVRGCLSQHASCFALLLPTVAKPLRRPCRAPFGCGSRSPRLPTVPLPQTAIISDAFSEPSCSAAGLFLPAAPVSGRLLLPPPAVASGMVGCVRPLLRRRAGVPDQGGCY